MMYWEHPSISIVSTKHQSSLQSSKTISAGQYAFFFKRRISPISTEIPTTSWSVGYFEEKSTFCKAQTKKIRALFRNYVIYFLEQNKNTIIPSASIYYQLKIYIFFECLQGNGCHRVSFAPEIWLTQELWGSCRY